MFQLQVIIKKFEEQIINLFKMTQVSKGKSPTTFTPSEKKQQKTKPPNSLHKFMKMAVYVVIP